MVWFVAVPAVCLLAIVALLSVPVRVDVRVERTRRTRTSWRVRLLFGLVDIDSERRAPRAPAGDGADETADAADEPKRRTRRRRRRSARTILRLVRSPGLLSRAGRLARRLASRVTVERLAAHVRIGFEDPADTGRFMGLVAPIAAIAAARGWPITIAPEFVEPACTGAGEARVRVRPIAVVGDGLSFLLSPPALRALRIWWRG